MLSDLPSMHDVVIQLHNEFICWMGELEADINVLEIFHHLEYHWCTSNNWGGSGVGLYNSRWLDSQYDKSWVSWCDHTLDWDQGGEMEVAKQGCWVSVDIRWPQQGESGVIHHGSVWLGWDYGQELLKGMSHWTNTFNSVMFFSPANSYLPPCLIMHQATQHCAKQLKTYTAGESFPIGGQTRTNCCKLFFFLCLMDLLTILQMPWSCYQHRKCCCDGPHYKDCGSGNDHCHLGIWPIPAWQPCAQWLTWCCCRSLNTCNQGSELAVLISSYKC